MTPSAIKCVDDLPMAHRLSLDQKRQLGMYEIKHIVGLLRGEIAPLNSWIPPTFVGGATINFAEKPHLVLVAIQNMLEARAWLHPSLTEDSSKGMKILVEYLGIYSQRFVVRLIELVSASWGVRGCAQALLYPHLKGVEGAALQSCIFEEHAHNSGKKGDKKGSSAEGKKKNSKGDNKFRGSRLSDVVDKCGEEYATLAKDMSCCFDFLIGECKLKDKHRFGRNKTQTMRHICPICEEEKHAFADCPAFKSVGTKKGGKKKKIDPPASDT